MKGLKGVFSYLGQGVRRVGSGSAMKSKRVFNAYEAKDYGQVFELTSNMNASSFLKDITRDEVSILQYCISDNNFEALEQLVKLPFFTELVNQDLNDEGWTPLLQAALKSHETDLSLVQLLVQHGADLTKAKKRDGTTCLHIAAGTNDIHLMDFIFKNLPNKKELVNRKNSDGWIPAHIAAFLNNFDSLNLLLENGADLQQKHDQGMTPVDEMIRNDHKDLLSCVYDKVRFMKRDLTIPGSFSVMHLAASSNSSDCLKYLLEMQGESANEICNMQDQASPLHFAIMAKNFDNSKLLLKFGALPNHKDSAGRTPMHIAVGLKNLPLVRLLDQYNADAGIKNNDGICPIDIAVTEDIKDIKLHFLSQRKYKNVDFS